MRKLTLLIITLFISQIVMAQKEKSFLEKNIISLEIGFLGSWINYEKELNDQFTLKTQIGAEGFISGGNDTFNYTFSPAISLEPRFYYNMEKREAKGKKIIHNSGNYLALTTTYQPDLYTITNDDIDTQPGFMVIPKWGLQRAIGKHFKFNFALGAGVYFRKNNSGVQPGLDLKIGYVF